MRFRSLSDHKFFRPAAAGVLIALAGVLAWKLPDAQFLSDGSYDILFRFGARQPANKVVVIQMDDASASALGTERLAWNRGLHARLLDKLTAGGCSLVAFDVYFEGDKDRTSDEQLATAMRRNGRMVLMAKWAELANPGTQTDAPLLPNPRFLDAATNWGIGKLDVVGAPVRRHWPFPCPVEGRPSLPWTAAKLAGAKLDDVPREMWLRYYGEHGGLERISYEKALEKPPDFFKDRIVFVGNKPSQLDPDVYEPDKFLTPFTRQTGEAVGGVELLATEFLNLVNRDWLRRFSQGLEFLALLIAGVTLGWFAVTARRALALPIAVIAVLLTLISAVALSYFTNFWFPWMIIAGVQIPAAFAVAMFPKEKSTKISPADQAAADEPVNPNKTIHLNLTEDPLPSAPEYELLTPPIGKGGFGKVWIARNAIGQWQALKAVYASKFGDDRRPYEAEFKGLQRYKPVSEKHPGLLRIELISRMKEEGYFYYVMELGDAQFPRWEKQPQLYKPKDLENLRKQAYGRRLPAGECLRIVTVLADALKFLHEQGLTHRDIKPSNVIFVNGRPKLADVGLVADIRPVEQVQTLVGTLGYMPPPPEKPGTPQADIYALGMLLYVISTGREPDLFPNLSTTLMERSGHAEFIRLNAIILKACQPDLDSRYQTIAQMHKDLCEAEAS